MADIRPQLATLLGKEATDIGDIRKTDEVPPRVSIIDVTMAITGKNRNQAAITFARLQNDYPEVTTNCCNLQFIKNDGVLNGVLRAVRSSGAPPRPSYTTGQQ